MAYKIADLIAEAKGDQPAGVTWASDAAAAAAKRSASATQDEAHEPAQKLTPEPQALWCSASTDSTPRQSPPDMSSNKRASQYKHGQPGREFEEERPDEPADEPKKATAAQLASRK